MLTDIECLQQCKQLIEQKLDWGNSSGWQTADFENLQQRILDSIGVSLSVSTLMRIWGRVKYDHLPSTTTLNTLAQFAGSDNWRTFVKEQNEKTATTVSATPAPIVTKPVNRTRMWSRIAAAIVVVTAIALIGLFAIRKPAPMVTDTAAYTFSSEPLSRSIPNSVVFTYDATASPTDSVYIQQSWDPMRRVWVDKNLHKHTSVYYEPGFYEAKLVINQQIVKEHRLIIPTNNWMSAIYSNALPVYLKPSQFIDNGALRVPISVIKENNIALQPYAPTLKYYNVGNFDPVPVTDFTFSAQVKNEYADGSSACQFAYIGIITDAAPIIIQLAIKGCAAELTIRNIDSVVNGKNADLSGFGVDFSDWATFSCYTTDSSIVYAVNGKTAYTFPKPSHPVNIVGIGFGFPGTGAVKNIQLSSKEKIVFEDFFTTEKNGLLRK